MQNKSTAPDAEGWQQVGGSQRRWDNEGGRGGFPSAFSKPFNRREERPAAQRQGGSWGAPPKEVNLDSAEDFPTLGGGKKAAAEPKMAGWASKAASWAAADEAEAAAERKRQAEQEEADKEHRRLTSGIPDLLGRILQRSDKVIHRGTFQEPLDYNEEGRPHSPPYDPDHDLAEYAAAAGNYQLHACGNAHLEGDEADDNGWEESR